MKNVYNYINYSNYTTTITEKVGIISATLARPMNIDTPPSNSLLSLIFVELKCANRILISIIILEMKSLQILSESTPPNCMGIEPPKKSHGYLWLEDVCRWKFWVHRQSNSYWRLLLQRDWDYSACHETYDKRSQANVVSPLKKEVSKDVCQTLFQIK